MLVASLVSTNLLAQDVTITIKKNDDKTTVVDDSGKEPFDGNRPAVDIAILLDTSNSMDGLILQAKTQLWNIVQQFAGAQKAGKTPVLRVSIFEYGNSGLPSTEGYIRQVVQLTDDLDKVSEALFSLKTNGGDEYCGQVIHEALKRLDWCETPNAYKAIFIAGNEPFTQGSVQYQASCKEAIQSGIIVNTIHCGNYQKGVSGKWKHGAELAEGEYLNINQDRKVVHIDAPQDKIIIELNSKLNRTYLWYGAKRERQSYKQNQILQDQNALSSSGGAGFGKGRGQTKASSLYNNRGRDLVDTRDADKTILSKLKKEQLPEAMQNMTQSERKTYLDSMAQKREEIKKQIKAASSARAKYVAEKQKELAESGLKKDTLGDVIASAIQKQLKNSGFEIKK